MPTLACGLIEFLNQFSRLQLTEGSEFVAVNQEAPYRPRQEKKRLAFHVTFSSRAVCQRAVELMNQRRRDEGISQLSTGTTEAEGAPLQVGTSRAAAQPGVTLAPRQIFGERRIRRLRE